MNNNDFGQTVIYKILRCCSYRANPMAYAWICGVRYTITLRKVFGLGGHFGSRFAGWTAVVEINGQTHEVFRETQKRAVEQMCKDIIHARSKTNA